MVAHQATPGVDKSISGVILAQMWCLSILVLPIAGGHHDLVFQPRADGNRAPGYTSHALGMGKGLSSKTPIVEHGMGGPLVGDVDRLRDTAGGGTRC